jgi:hypothetical protein
MPLEQRRGGFFPPNGGINPPLHQDLPPGFLISTCLMRQES